MQVFGLGMFDMTGGGLGGSYPGLFAIMSIDAGLAKGSLLTTQVMIELLGYTRRNGSSLPTPFWTITMVVDASMAD